MPDWEADAKPVLAAIYGLDEDAQLFSVTSTAVAKALGRDHAEVVRVMSYLSEADYLVTDNSIDQASGEITVEVRQLTEKSLQQLAGWPVAGISGDIATKLVAAIEARMAEASPEERNRLEKLRGAVTEVGKDVIAQVLAKLATQQV